MCSMYPTAASSFLCIYIYTENRLDTNIVELYQWLTLVGWCDKWLIFLKFIWLLTFKHRHKRGKGERKPRINVHFYNMYWNIKIKIPPGTFPSPIHGYVCWGRKLKVEVMILKTNINKNRSITQVDEHI